MKLPRAAYIAALSVTIGGAVLATRTAPAKGDFDLTGLNNQVQSHETRIKALENKTDQTQTQVNQNTADTQVLQKATNTPPAPAVAPVVTPVEQAPAAPAETVVVAVGTQITSDGNICRYEYSDGTTASESASTCKAVGSVK